MWASCRVPSLLVQQVPVGSFRILGGLLIVQKPERGVEPALQFLLDQALGRFPVLLVDPLGLPCLGFDQFLGGPKPVITNPF